MAVLYPGNQIQSQVLLRSRLWSSAGWGTGMATTQGCFIVLPILSRGRTWHTEVLASLTVSLGGGAVPGHSLTVLLLFHL